VSLWQIPEVGEVRKAAAQLRLPEKMFIDGTWRDSAGGQRLDVVNPYTEQVIGTIPAGTREDAAAAVAAARKAFDEGPWPRLSPRERARLLFRVAELLRKHQEEFAILECLDNGKPVTESQWAAIAAAGVFEYYGGWADKYYGEIVPLNSPFLNLVTRNPVGVIGAIIPWNFPTTQATFKTVPAIAMGNTVVLKPAEQCSLTALRMAELIQEAGIPDGVWNVVTGMGEDAGAALCELPGVDAVAFTGSSEVGRKVMAAASGTLKKVSLECGGKSPDIIFADADLDAAVPGAFSGMFYNQGEVCNAGTRLLVHEDIYDSVLERFVALAGDLRLGDPLDRDTQLGCLISSEQFERNLRYIEIGKAEGARLVAGGNRWGTQGYFVEPTIFTDVKSSMRIAQEEIFGPVLVVLPFGSTDEAVALANDSAYGLAAGLWTRDLHTAHDVSERLQAGTVWVNTFGPFDIASPWTGYKQSGVGTEWGRDILEFVTTPKSIWFPK
jgi:acyl-CoA reductase-like NAD-dependent aldehyde dehydrogenase